MGHALRLCWPLLRSTLPSIMPLVVGICGMRQVPFQAANLVSAVIWATGVLTPGMVAVEGLLR